MESDKITIMCGQQKCGVENHEFADAQRVAFEEVKYKLNDTALRFLARQLHVLYKEENDAFKGSGCDREALRKSFGKTIEGRAITVSKKADDVTPRILPKRDWSRMDTLWDSSKARRQAKKNVVPAGQLSQTLFEEAGELQKIAEYYLQPEASISK